MNFRHVLVRTRYLILLSASSKICSLNPFGGVNFLSWLGGDSSMLLLYSYIVAGVISKERCVGEEEELPHRLYVVSVYPFPCCTRSKDYRKPKWCAGGS